VPTCEGNERTFREHLLSGVARHGLSGPWALDDWCENALSDLTVVAYGLLHKWLVPGVEAKNSTRSNRQKLANATANTHIAEARPLLIDCELNRMHMKEVENIMMFRAIEKSDSCAETEIGHLVE